MSSTAWPLAMASRWCLGRFFVHAVAQALGLAVLAAALHPHPGAVDFIEVLDQLGSVFTVYLVQGAVAAVGLWVFGRSGSRRRFRALSLLMFVGLWLPLQMFTSPPVVAAVWLCVSLAAVMTTRQPEPAYYGPPQGTVWRSCAVGLVRSASGRALR